MNKKSIIGILIVIVIIIISIGGYFLFSNTANKKENNLSTNVNTENDKDKQSNDKITSSNTKTLVVYFSASGSTKKVAKQISKNLNADLFELIPEDIYTADDLDWTDNHSRVSREHDEESLRDIKLKNTKVDNWDSYDTVLIGYPIWWGIAAWPVNTFIKANNFNGKTVIPFCTSASSGLGQSGDLLAKEAKSGNWKEGYRFSSGASNQDIKKWTDSLK